MGLKILAFAVLLASGLWLLGYGPQDLARLGAEVSEGSASTISTDTTDWG